MSTSQSWRKSLGRACGHQAVSACCRCQPLIPSHSCSPWRWVVSAPSLLLAPAVFFYLGPSVLSAKGERSPIVLLAHKHPSNTHKRYGVRREAWSQPNCGVKRPQSFCLEVHLPSHSLSPSRVPVSLPPCYLLSPAF